jgi:hypothetical protein
MSDDGPEWFAPKRFGYGSGLPIAWQGWAITIVFMAVAVATALLYSGRPIVVFAILVPLTAMLLVITAKTTRGGWRWRWGGKD